MKNQARVCLIVVLMCVICPILTGFVWPVSEGTETVYNVEKTQNITDDYMTGTVDLYGEFTDIYANNINIFAQHEDDGYMMSAQPAALTLTDTGLPALNPYGNYIMTYHANQDPYEISDIDSFIDYLNPHAGKVYGVVFMIGDWDEIDIDGTDGEVAYSFIYYPGSKTYQYLDQDYQWLTPVTGVTGITYCATDGSYDINVQYLIELTSPVHYADLSKGFILYNANETFGVDNVWLNGYENSMVDILFKTHADMDIYLKFRNQRIGGGFETLWMYVDDYTDSIRFYLNGDAMILGSIDDYPYILLRFDASNDVISLSGLPGMTSYMDSYESMIRKTVSMDYPLSDIHYILMKNAWHGVEITYYIPKTISNITHVTGINNKSNNISLYGDGLNYQVTLKLPQLYPTDEFYPDYFGSISFAGAYGHVNKDKTVTWSYNNQNICTVPLENMTIQVIDGTKIYVNGNFIYDSVSFLSSADLLLRGQWLVNIYYSQLVPSTHPAYDWLPGGFGLDESAYCIVGLMTAVSMGIIGMVVGRRTGSSAAAVMLTAGICGSVYMIILMNGL